MVLVVLGGDQREGDKTNDQYLLIYRPMLPDSLTQSLTAVASIVRFSPNAQQLEALLSKIPLSLSDIAPEERFHCLLAATVILHQTGMGAQNLKVESVVSKMKDGGEVDRLLGWSLKLA